MEMLVMAGKPEHSAREQEIAILATVGKNGRLIAEALQRAGLSTTSCANVTELCRAIQQTLGAVVLCEEALDQNGLSELGLQLGAQPPWSELPVLVLTGGGETTRGSVRVADVLGARGNITLLERPVRILTLVSAAKTALRARRRQYQIRDLLLREQSARAQAEAASQAKDRFLAMLSHELRTPLNPVLMSVSAMLMDPNLPQPLREDLELVKRNIELESKLIDDLLDLTRIARGKLVLQPDVVDLHALVLHAIKTCCESDINRKQLSIRTEMHAGRHHVWGDSARLSQVVWNLVKNAVKFTPDHGTITIRSRTTDDGGIAISVSDTGIGIEKEHLHRIFDAFEQASRTVARQYGGLGLGLAICRALVHAHGGTVQAHSPGHGQGATFTVKLETIDAPASAEARPSGSDNNRFSPRTVLLVEDHESTARVMAKLLGSLNFRVHVARDVRSARGAAENDRIDLLISDLGLPDGTGYDVLRYLNRDRQVPAIAVSGYGMEDDLAQSVRAGFQEHLVKPIDFAKLRTAIGRVLKGDGESS
jgi:signal transduction histidine kinase/ActR/RegA family two-component response regulator